MDEGLSLQQNLSQNVVWYCCDRTPLAGVSNPGCYLVLALQHKTRFQTRQRLWQVCSVDRQHQHQTCLQRAPHCDQQPRRRKLGKSNSERERQGTGLKLFCLGPAAHANDSKARKKSSATPRNRARAYLEHPSFALFCLKTLDTTLIYDLQSSAPILVQQEVTTVCHNCFTSCTAESATLFV